MVKLAHGLPDHASFLKRYTSELLMITPSCLNERQFCGISLTVAYFLKNEELVNSVRADAKLFLDESDVTACRTAVILMALAGNYFMGLEKMGVGKMRVDGELIDKQVPKVPLSVDVRDFELYCLTVSVLSHNDPAINTHVQNLLALKFDPKVFVEIAWVSSLLKAVDEAMKIDQIRTYDFITRRATM